MYVAVRAKLGIAAVGVYSLGGREHVQIAGKSRKKQLSNHSAGEC